MRGLDTMKSLGNNSEITHSWYWYVTTVFRLQYMQKKVWNLSILDEAVKRNKLTNILSFNFISKRSYHGLLKATWNSQAKQYCRRFVECRYSRGFKSLLRCTPRLFVKKRRVQQTSLCLIASARLFKSFDKNIKKLTLQSCYYRWSDSAVRLACY